MSPVVREKTVYPYSLFALIREKTVYPYTLLMRTLNCILNCSLGTTASQEGLHLEVSSSSTRFMERELELSRAERPSRVVIDVL